MTTPIEDYVIGSLVFDFQMNLRREKWYNPRVYLIIVPVGGIFAYFISKMSVVSYFTLNKLIGLNLAQVSLFNLSPYQSYVIPRYSARLTISQSKIPNHRIDQPFTKQCLI